MNTETDPLAITAEDSLSIFGESADNIEIVIESDNDSEEEEDESKEPIVIHVSGLNEKDEEFVISKHISAVNKKNAEVDTNLLVPNVEKIKDEIEIEEEGLQIPSEDESEVQILVQGRDAVQENEVDNGIPIGRKPNPRCYVPNCTVDEKEEYPVYWFKPPKDRNVRKIWDNCIDRPDKRLDPEDVFCDQHFSESDIIYKIDNSTGVVQHAGLREGAVPCVKFYDKCCVPTCKSETGPMFSFPVLQTSNFDLWLYMIRNPNLRRLKLKELMRHRVCAIHFEPDCFEDDLTLKITAAPTLYVPAHQNIKAFSDDNPISPPASKSSVKLCAYRNCKNTSHGGKILFKFPQDPDKCIAWLKACGRGGLISTPEDTVRKVVVGKLSICDDHFNLNDFVTTNLLKPNAVPKSIEDDSVLLIRKTVAFEGDNNQSSYNKLGAVKRNYKSAFSEVCSYKDCINKASPDNPFFSFPVNPERCIAWLKACGREELISTPEETVKKVVAAKLSICEDHFKLHDFVNSNLLKPSAVPKPIEVDSDQFIRKSVSFAGDNQSLPKKSGTLKRCFKSAFSGVCSYRDCINKASADNPFFSFPVDPERSEKWLKACGLTTASPSSRYQIIKNQRICSKHFEPYMFENEFKLKPGAMPRTYKKEENVESQRKISRPRNRSDPSKMLNCAVSSCPNSYGLSYGKGRFPHPNHERERFNIWIKLVSNPALKGRIPQDIYNRFMVCLNHFEPQFYMKDGKIDNLTKDAVPTKLLTADVQWLLSTDYYKNRLQGYNLKFDKPVANKDKEEDKEKQSKDINTTCVLEADGIRFPATGHHISVEKKPNSKRKLPYEVYKFSKSGYGVNDDIAVGENVKIHTAIIIDDDDEIERQVLQQLLDKRRKY